MKYQLRIRNTTSGFTLIELIVVMVILMTIGLVIGAILVTALRGSNKTLVISNVRENGNYAIQLLSKQIRYAKTFYGVSNSGDVGSYIQDCSLPAATEYNYVMFETFKLDTVKYSCTNTIPPSIKITTVNDAGVAQPDITLIDEKTIEVVSCRFTCSQSTLASPYIIGIDFSLKQKTSSKLVERTSSVIPFQTSVTLRNAPR